MTGERGGRNRTERDGTRKSRPRQFYGRRVGRPLRPARRRLMQELLPRLAIHAGSVPADPRELFRPAKMDRVWLEIGFGAGEHLAAQAADHPDTGFIGCEPYVNGVAALLDRIDRGGQDNIRIWDDDARDLIDGLGDATIGRVFLLFPDPWPKSRHARRRFIGPDTLDSLARIMTDGAELRVASDDPGYIRWALTELLRHPAFEWVASRADDWRQRPADQPETRYEAKARARGIKPVFLLARRQPR